MRCPKCGSDRVTVIKVVEGENMEGENMTTRTYGCNNCGNKFLTIEHIHESSMREA